jgi:formylglycine-generating enzyme required for sulfatase activity
MALGLIQPGSFMMGSAVDGHDQPVHKVTLTKPFYMGQYEVTPAQWKLLTCP